MSHNLELKTNDFSYIGHNEAFCQGQNEKIVQIDEVILPTAGLF